MIALLLHLCLPTALSASPTSAVVVPDYTESRQRIAAQLEVIDGLIDAGMPGQALQVVNQVRETGTKGTELDVLEARALLNTGMGEDAQIRLEQVLEREPRNADALALYGVVLADAGQLDKSIKALGKANRLRKNDPEILNNLGYAHMANGELDEALRLFRASLAINPSQPKVRNNLGHTFARLGKDQEALAAFRTADTEGDARYNMGVACENRSDRASAIAHYQAAVQASPGHPAANTALKRLLSQEVP